MWIWDKHIGSDKKKLFRRSSSPHSKISTWRFAFSENHVCVASTSHAPFSRLRDPPAPFQRIKGQSYELQTSKGTMPRIINNKISISLTQLFFIKRDTFCKGFLLIIF
jgi:hypothetical protein